MTMRADDKTRTEHELEQRLREEQDENRRLRATLKVRRVRHWLTIAAALCFWAALQLARADFRRIIAAERSRADYWQHEYGEAKRLLGHALAQWEHVVDIGEHLADERDQCLDQVYGLGEVKTFVSRRPAWTIKDIEAARGMR